MSGIKLTHSLRISIVKILVAYGGFYTAESQARSAYDQAGYNFYNAVFANMLPTLNEINKVFLRYGTSFDLDFGECINKDPTIRAILKGRTYLPVSVPAEYPRPVYCLTLDELGIDLDNPLVESLLQSYRAWTIATDERQRVWDAVSVALSKFDTVEQLFDTWAEVVPILTPFIPHHADTISSGESFSTLNELLNLTKEQTNGS